MMHWLRHIAEVIDFKDAGILFLIYLLGFNFSKYVYGKYKSSGSFSFLIKYPAFITRVLEELNHTQLPFPSLLLVILMTNVSTMYIGFLSGFVPYLTYIFIFYLGLNLGMTQLLLLPDKPLWILFMNPIALLEIPAILMAAAAGVQMTIISLDYISLKVHFIQFKDLLPFIVQYPVLILLVSAILESWLVIISRKLQIPT